MCWPQLTGSCSQGRPPSHTSSPREFQVQDEEQVFDPKMERFFSFFTVVFSSLGSRHLPSGRRMSKDLREVLVNAEAVGRRVKTWDFSFRLHDIIVRKLEYSVEFWLELKLEYLEELKLGFSAELIGKLIFVGKMCGQSPCKHSLLTNSPLGRSEISP